MLNLPYCNSARYCEFLSANSSFYDFSQTTNRIFRLNQHMIPIVLTLIIAILTIDGSGKSPYALVCVVAISFFIVTYFLAYHGDTAEGILIAAFLDEGLSDQAPPEFAPALIRKAYQDDKEDTYKKASVKDLLIGLDACPE